MYMEKMNCNLSNKQIDSRQLVLVILYYFFVYFFQFLLTYRNFMARTYRYLLYKQISWLYINSDEGDASLMRSWRRKAFGVEMKGETLFCTVKASVRFVEKHSVHHGPRDLLTRCPSTFCFRFCFLFDSLKIFGCMKHSLRR